MQMAPCGLNFDLFYFSTIMCKKLFHLPISKQFFFAYISIYIDPPMTTIKHISFKTQNVTLKNITLSKSCQILKFENEASYKQNKE
jgi:hypothetical protein